MYVCLPVKLSLIVRPGCQGTPPQHNKWQTGYFIWNSLQNIPPIYFFLFNMESSWAYFPRRNEPCLLFCRIVLAPKLDQDKIVKSTKRKRTEAYLTLKCRICISPVLNSRSSWLHSLITQMFYLSDQLSRAVEACAMIRPGTSLTFSLRWASLTQSSSELLKQDKLLTELGSRLIWNKTY